MLTPDDLRRYAAELILNHARDVELYHVQEHLDEEDDATARAIHDLIQQATITVDWPTDDTAAVAR